MAKTQKVKKASCSRVRFVFELKKKKERHIKIYIKSLQGCNILLKGLPFSIGRYIGFYFSLAAFLKCLNFLQ